MWILDNLWLVPAIPFASFWLILFFGKAMPRKGSEIGVAALAADWILAAWAVVAWIRRPVVGTGEEAIRHYIEHNYTWFNDGQIKIVFGFHTDGLAVMMMIVVIVIIHIYIYFSLNKN